jgi:hypothetical protein
MSTSAARLTIPVALGIAAATLRATSCAAARPLPTWLVVLIAILTDGRAVNARLLTDWHVDIVVIVRVQVGVFCTMIVQHHLFPGGRLAGHHVVQAVDSLRGKLAEQLLGVAGGRRGTLSRNRFAGGLRAHAQLRQKHLALAGVDEFELKLVEAELRIGAYFHRLARGLLKLSQGRPLAIEQIISRLDRGGEFQPHHLFIERCNGQPPHQVQRE